MIGKPDESCRNRDLRERFLEIRILADYTKRACRPRRARIAWGRLRTRRYQSAMMRDSMHAFRRNVQAFYGLAVRFLAAGLLALVSPATLGSPGSIEGTEIRTALSQFEHLHEGQKTTGSRNDREFRSPRGSIRKLASEFTATILTRFRATCQTQIRSRAIPIDIQPIQFTQLNV